MTEDALTGLSALVAGKSDALDLLGSVLDRESLGVGIFQPIEGGRGFRLVYVNEPFKALKPFRPMLGRLSAEVWPELAEFATPRFREVLETGVPWVEREIPLEVEASPGAMETRYYTYEISRLPVGGEALILEMATDVTHEVAGRAALRESETKYRNLFTNLIDGFALHRVVLDEHGKPVDYVFLEVNAAFEALSGLKAEDILGRRVTEVLPGIENDPADWIRRYGSVALTGEAIRFEQYAEPLDRWYQVSAYRPEEGRFVTVFDDITERKRAEAERAEAMRGLREKDRAIRQAYSDVIDAVTGGRLVILGHDELEASLAPRIGGGQVAEPPDLAVARRQLRHLLGDLPDVAELVLAFSEGATNMLKHASGGTYEVRRDERRVQVVLSDDGPGIDFRNLPKATLVSGFSTKQTLGMGFSVMMELTDRLLLCTDPRGTTLLLEWDERR